MVQPLNDNYYHARWVRIVNVMKASNLGLSRIAPAGSRAKKQHRPDSDYDVIFAVSGNPSRGEFYPILIAVLESNFDNADVYPGSNNNVVHVDFHRGGNFDLVLLTESDFDREYKSIKDFKKTNL